MIFKFFITKVIQLSAAGNAKRVSGKNELEFGGILGKTVVADYKHKPKLGNFGQRGNVIKLENDVISFRLASTK